MALRPELAAVLACPNDDHGELHEQTRDGAPVLVCASCGLAFAIDGDIPVLLLDDALEAESPDTPAGS